MNTFQALLPVPQKVTLLQGKSLKTANLQTFYVDEIFKDLVPDIELLFAGFAFTIQLVSDKENADLKIVKGDLPPESFSIKITENMLEIQAGTAAGAFYAVNALRQMMFAALIKGPANAELTCGTLEDAPRFAFRSFHIDSARHFQNVNIIKRLLKLMAHCRLNIFHWHLIDSQGWRLQLKCAPGLENVYTNTPGFYTAEAISDVIAYARKLHIEIIPEVDFPGHSHGTLQHFPQYACSNAVEPGEFCLGNPAGKTFIKNVIQEVMELFPQSQYIHIGGDEAAVENWEKCPRCQAAMQQNNCRSMRELENKFMQEIADFVLSNNRKPILWGTCSGQTYSPDSTIQVWLDIREPLRVAPNGNKVIYSVHNSLYFDYPANLSEPWESWMFELSERGVYMTDPYIIWQDKVQDCIIGTEACLWTETVPQWRVIPKVMPRILAYSECAWSQQQNKDYNDFSRRKELLEATGFTDYLQTNDLD